MEQSKYQGSFPASPEAAKPPPEKKRKKAPLKRRPPLSCTECRRRKVRCDKLQPSCSRCLKGKKNCIYVGPQDWSAPANITRNVSATAITTATASTSSTVSDDGRYAGSTRSSLSDTNYSAAAINYQQSCVPIGFLNPEESHRSNSFPDTKIINQHDVLKTYDSMLPGAHTHKLPFDNNRYSLGNINDKLSELQKLKSRVTELENELKEKPTPSSETISLITSLPDDRIANYIFFKNTRFMLLGSFQRAVLWLKDPIMSKIPELFNLIRVKADGKDKNSKFVNVRRRDKPVTQVLKKHIKQKKLGRDTKSNPIPNTEQVNVLDLNNLAVLLLQYLPNEVAIPIYIKRFFDVIYPFFPILDEHKFRAKVTKILSYKNGKPVLMKLTLQH
ncbi:unnamed protein product [Ambrosiozyma monospora]|uniref:Unnamed protein product n=1 Tax=Ambrosiozyma monospora TaxID=43982 RepID=A0ACB5T9B5_AMBMO|nr:unnamed protein product [Ambrosiozyma monospora]